MFNNGDGPVPAHGPAVLTKAELVEEVSRITELPRKEAAIIVEGILDSMVHAIERGDKVEIRGFGSYHTRSRRARAGRNPKTGARVEVPARRVPFFKPGKAVAPAGDETLSGSVVQTFTPPKQPRARNLPMSTQQITCIAVIRGSCEPGGTPTALMAVADDAAKTGAQPSSESIAEATRATGQRTGKPRPPSKRTAIFINRSLYSVTAPAAESAPNAHQSGLPAHFWHNLRLLLTVKFHALSKRLLYSSTCAEGL